LCSASATYQLPRFDQSHTGYSSTAADRLDKGRLIIPKSFFDPLPDELLDAFEGKNSF
jgi:hypothetical protein